MTIPGGHGSRPDPDEQELARAVDASAALRQLLAAAAAPPSSAELKGRARAVAAFRAAHRRRRGAGTLADQAGAGSSRVPLTRARRWTAAQFTVACAALAVVLGGTAVAAAAGQLPTALQDAVSDIFNGPDPTAPPGPTRQPEPLPSSGAHDASPRPSATGTVAASSPARSSRPPGIGSPTAGRPTRAQLAGLCEAYRAAGAPARALSTPGFAPLVGAAGGVAAVDGFCAGLPGKGAAAVPSRTAVPSGTARPSRTAVPRDTAVPRRTAVPSGTGAPSGSALLSGTPQSEPSPSTPGHPVGPGGASGTPSHSAASRPRSGGAQFPPPPAHRSQTPPPSRH